MLPRRKKHLILQSVVAVPRLMLTEAIASKYLSSTRGKSYLWHVDRNFVGEELCKKFCHLWNFFSSFMKPSKTILRPWNDFSIISATFICVIFIWVKRTKPKEIHLVRQVIWNNVRLKVWSGEQNSSMVEWTRKAEVEYEHLPSTENHTSFSKTNVSSKIWCSPPEKPSPS